MAAPYSLPTFADTLAAAGMPAAPPSVSAVAPPEPSNALVAGFKSGLYGTGAALAGAYQGAAKLVGADGLADRYGAKAAEYTASQQAASRPDLEGASFFSSSFLPKLGYTLAQSAPGLAGAVAGGALATAALPEEAALGAGTLVGRIGASLPKLFGGAGVGAGFGADVGADALVAGARTAAGIGGAAVPMAAQSFGDQVNTAAQQPGGLTRGDAARAALQAVPIGVAQGLVPGEGAILAGGGQGILGAARRGLLGTVVDHGIKNAAAGAVGSGLQAAADTSFDPSMSASDRASKIVEAVAQGAQAGGLLGGAFGLLHRSPAEQMAAVDAGLKGNGLDPAAPSAAPTPPPPAPPAPEPVQQELPLSAPLSAAAEGTQPSLFGEGSDAKGTPLPYDAGKVTPRAARSDSSVQAEIRSAISARDAEAAAAAAKAPPPEPTTSDAPASLPVAPTTARDALRAPDDPPPNAFLQSLIADPKNGLRVGQRPSPFKEFVANSKATSLPELYNELLAVKADDPVAGSSSPSNPFNRLVTRLGVGDPTLDQQLAELQANPDTANVKALADLQFKVGLRDHAATMRAPEPAAEAHSPAAAPDVPAAAGPDATPARTVAPPAARLLDLDIPELADHEPTAAVRAPAEAQAPSPDAAPAGAADDTPDSIAADLQALLSGGGQGTATKSPIDFDRMMRTMGARRSPALGRGLGDLLQENAQGANAGPAVDAIRAGADAGPKPITERVLDAARQVTGDKGGEVDVKDIRAALPDVAAKDIDAALREIHTDDSDNVLRQAPKGQRTGDGVSVPGQGRFHKLELEERDAGVQERSATPEAGADQPGSGGEVARGDAGVGDPAGPGPTVEEGGQPAPEVGGPDNGEAPGLTAGLRQPPAPEAGTPRLLDPASYKGDYPGDDAVAKMAGVRLNDTVMQSGVGNAVRTRLQGLWNMGQDGKFDANFASTVRDLRSTFNLPVAKAGIERGADGRSKVLTAGAAQLRDLQAEHAATDPAARTAPDTAARDAALAPSDPNSRMPEQAPAQQAAASRVLTTPDTAPGKAKATRRLRVKAKADTALIETPQGDQIPTAAVGGELPDLVQASASVADPAPSANGVSPDIRAAHGQITRDLATFKTAADAMAARDPDSARALEKAYIQAGGHLNNLLEGRGQAYERASNRAGGSAIESLKYLKAADTPEFDAVKAAAEKVASGMEHAFDALETDTGGGSLMAKLPRDDTPFRTGRLDEGETLAYAQKLVRSLSPDAQARIGYLRAGDRIPGHGDVTINGYNGVYTGEGKVFLNLSGMRNHADIEDTISHEVFGHMGSNADLGGLGGKYDDNRYIARFSDIFRRAGGREGLEKMARELGVWSFGDAGHNLNSGAGLSAYFPKENRPLTPFEQARVADELIAHRAAIRPSALDTAISQAQDRFRGAIVNVLRRLGLHNFAKRMSRFTQAELSDWVAQSRQALTAKPRPGDIDMVAAASGPRHFVPGTEPTGMAPFAAQISRHQRDAEGVLGYAASLRNHIVTNHATRALFSRPESGGQKPGPAEALRNASRKVVYNVMPGNFFHEQATRAGMPTVADHYEAGKAQGTAQIHLNGPANRVAQDQMNLRAADPVQERRLSKVMALATSNNLNPEVPLERHSWLSPAEVEAARPAYAELKAEWDRLGKPGKGGVVTNGQQVYRDQAAMGRSNWYMGRAMATHSALRTVFGDAVDAGYDPTKRYAGLDHSYVDATGRSLAEDLHGKVAPTEAYWQGEFRRLQDIAETHLQGEGGKDGNAGTQPFVDLAKLVENNREGEKGYVQQGNYFRLGRGGDYAVGFHVAPEVDELGKPSGRPDPAALQALKDGYAKDFPQVGIGYNEANGRVFARFPSQEQAENFYSRVAEGGALRRYIDPEKDTHVSLLTEAQGGDDKVPFMQSMLDATAAKLDAELSRYPEGDPRREEFADAREKLLGNMRATIMDQLGDTSMRSIQAKRDNVQGFSTDMLENQKNAASTFARAAATTAFQGDKADALAAAQAAIGKVERSGAQGALGRAAGMKALLNGYLDRNSASEVRVDNSFLSMVKSKLHTFQLGASPAYIVMNMSQIGTLGLPELAKFHGFPRSVAAMTGALGDTGKVIRAMAQTRLENSDGSKGPRAIFEGGITKAVLDAAGLSRDTRNFLSTLANHGHLELGSYSAVNSGLGVGNLSRVGRFQHYANSTALLAETMGRLVMAFASKRLHEDMPAGQQRDSMLRQFPTPEAYAGHTVSESMLQWGSYNSPKLFTAGGALGKFGPTVTQFHGYVPRLVEKLYRESMDGFTSRLGQGPAADAQRAEARRFVMAHLAATIAMSGGLGLPFAGYAASAATKLSGSLLDQPYDFEAHMRGFLAHTFGPGIGEIMSRGLPRYLGVDMSELGDSGMLPLSKLMEDRSKLEDAVPAYLAHAWGSAPGAGLNFLLAARELSEGRFSEAMARALPTSLRNLVRSYRVSQYGYINAAGEKLPVAAGAAEVLKTALGLQGGDMVEERERQEALAGLKEDRQYRSQRIKKDVLMGVENHDSSLTQRGFDAARKFDQDNPGISLSKELGPYVQSRAVAGALGQKFGVLGLDPKDRVGRGLINY